MSDSADDIAADLSKKERLINAWIAVGPEGKTTDVSDLTGSSRGYASDIRRSMADEDEGDELLFEEIEDAHDPELVEEYRSELADDAIDGHWQFTDRLTDEPADDTESPGPVAGEPVSRSRAGPSITGPAPQPPDPGGNAPQQPPQQPSQQPQQPSQQPQQPSQPPQRSPRQPTQSPQGHGEPGSRTAARGPGGQQAPNTGSHPGRAPQSAQQSQAGRQRRNQPAPARPPVPSGFRDRLADLDQQLIAQQQRTSAELDQLPRGSQAYAIAVSKYNLVVDLRESLRQLASVAPGP